MARHKAGTLVRAYTKEEIGDERWELNSADEFITPNGYIWIVQRFIPVRSPYNEHRRDAYECRAVATGVVTQLFPDEITTRVAKEQTDGQLTSNTA
jgi:hypothetical protein